MADEIWNQLRQETDKQGKDEERRRCAVLVEQEISAGRAAGIPETSATIRILQRLHAAIDNGQEPVYAHAHQEIK